MNFGIEFYADHAKDTKLLDDVHKGINIYYDYFVFRVG